MPRLAYVEQDGMMFQFGDLSNALNARIFLDQSADFMVFTVPASHTFEWDVDTALACTLSTTELGLPDNVSIELGTDDDSVLRHRSTTLAANTVLTDVVLGTPVVPAIAANTLIVSNVTADGDIIFITQTGGNSQAFMWIDASAGTLNLFGAGTAAAIVSATAVEIEDNIFLALGNDQDGVLMHRTATLAANTSLTGVLIGTPVAQALAADSMMMSNVTASGDVAMYGNVGGNSAQFLFCDTSASTLYFGQTGWAVDVLNGAVKLTMGTQSTFATTQPTNAIVFRTGTAAAGAITTACGIMSAGVTLEKIIADGTVSTIQT